ncbi:hypothetical protein BJ944DRAFT_229305 [Cunninghamella echinulata]|nr:hypothetical protein BJ944DRAFT_229305 [Cunninghamella echinulata]
MNLQAKELLSYTTFNIIRPATPPEYLGAESEHCDEEYLMLVDSIKRNVESNKKTTLIVRYQKEKLLNYLKKRQEISYDTEIGIICDYLENCIDIWKSERLLDRVKAILSSQNVLTVVGFNSQVSLVG